MSKYNDIPEPCCESWRHAHDFGTDAEGYGAAIRNMEGADDGPMMSGELPVIKFCPWCGAAKSLRPIKMTG